MTIIQAYEHHCLRCDFVWKSFNEHPGVCTKCKSHAWSTPSSRPKREPIADANEQQEDTP